ncbi:unnamed protein product [Trichogramma brassicae]|uniref:Uncharacterized protein n=1 Tax=Trichogramma brassicae TaxID=86971 RepID=A0A6H5IX85_9HYME|nr:unnamed protein product [Trichogramma brassicae]
MREQYRPCVPTTEARYYKRQATTVRKPGLLRAHDAIVNNIFVRAARESSAIKRSEGIRVRASIVSICSVRLILIHAVHRQKQLTATLLYGSYHKKVDGSKNGIETKVHRGRAGGRSAAAATRRRPPPLVVFNKREYYGVRIDARGSFFSIVERLLWDIRQKFRHIAYEQYVTRSSKDPSKKRIYRQGIHDRCYTAERVPLPPPLGHNSQGPQDDDVDDFTN